MEPMYLSIQQKETGKQIKKLLMENGYTVKDVQNAMGFENPQAIYKWISGRSLPSLDNFVILSRLLHTSIEDILVVDGDADCRQNAFGQHSRSVFLVFGSKSVYLINNKHFWVPLFPFLAIIFASFFRFMQANVSPTFISIRAFPIICV